jgi:hypothetical protein
VPGAAARNIALSGAPTPLSGNDFHNRRAWRLNGQDIGFSLLVGLEQGLPWTNGAPFAWKPLVLRPAAPGIKGMFHVWVQPRRIATNRRATGHHESMLTGLPPIAW